MTRSLTIAALLFFFSAQVFAQAAKPAAPAKPAKPQATQVAEAKPARKSRRGQDARHCLGQSSNAAIIRCAEAYL